MKLVGFLFETIQDRVPSPPNPRPRRRTTPTSPWSEPSLIETKQPILLEEGSVASR